MTFDIFDPFYTSRLWMYNDLEVQFRNQRAQVSPEIAYRMSRYTDEFAIEKKTVPFNPDSWKQEQRLIWSCNVSAANGYGMVAENTIKTLLALGVRVLNPKEVSGSTISGGEYVDPTVLQSLKQTIIPDCIEIQHCQPPALKMNVVERIWTYTMFETTHTPRSWVKMLNQVERVIVPSKWLVDSWREQGVTVPIHVVGHGIDPTVYYELERPERETFTFLHLGKLSTRKGSDLVTRAFLEAFAGKDDAKLILKNNEPYFGFYNGIYGHPQIECISATYSKEQMRELYQRADCFVFPTRGEGFGLTPFEAMACGLPTIVTGWGGCADFCDPDDTLILDYSMSHSHEFDVIYKDFFEAGEDAGDWAQPSIEHLKELMLWAYEHRKESKAMGKRAAKRLVREWTWEKKIGDLVELLNSNV